MDTVDLYGYLGGIFLMINFVPQVFRTWKLKESDQISILLLLLMLTSTFFHEVYSIMLELTSVIVMNGVFFVLVLIQLILTLRYRSTNSELK